MPMDVAQLIANRPLLSQLSQEYEHLKRSGGEYCTLLHMTWGALPILGNPGTKSTRNHSLVNK